MTLQPPARFLSDFAVSQPEWVAETAIAQIWKVRCADGRPAALKHYKAKGMGHESAGFAYLRQFNGGPAAHVYALRNDAALLEWLEGPSPGDVARQGDLLAADRALGDAAAALHAMPVVLELPPLEARFAALLECRAQDVPAGALRGNILRCQTLAEELLRDQPQPCALHGDLHHENLRQTARGYCAFDAKGLCGDRAFELANAFRHPIGCEDLIRQPAVIRRRAHLWAAALQVPARRLLAWAAVKCALSIVWRQPPGGAPDPEGALLAVLLDQYHEGT